MSGTILFLMSRQNGTRGGKPSPGTPADKRLKENKPGAKQPKIGRK